ncbi:MAG: YfiR family protein [Bacteroidia bacterium]
MARPLPDDSIMKRLLFIVCCFLLPSVFGFQVGPTGDANARLKSVFLYNFTRYIEWPEEYKTGNFVINVYGSNSGLLMELNNMAKVKTVGSQKIEIKQTTLLDGIGKPHILYVTPENSAQLSDIITKLKGKSTLLVTEKPGLAGKGSAINFVIVENKQKFELNKTNAEKYSLKVSSALVNLAIPVDKEN